MIAHLKFGLPWVFPAALAVVVIYAAEILPYLGNFGRFGDMSYGLYIIHYPVLHVIAALAPVRRAREFPSPSDFRLRCYWPSCHGT